MASNYDNADRLIADADAGTNGGTAWTPPSLVPASSATLLVTQYAYNPAGWVQDTIDPMGIDTRDLYDNLGRTTETIQNYTGGMATAESNVATEYGYDGNDNVLYVRADEPNGSYQQTNYVYGVTTASGSGVNSNDIPSAMIESTIIRETRCPSLYLLKYQPFFPLVGQPPQAIAQAVAANSGNEVLFFCLGCFPNLGSDETLAAASRIIEPLDDS